MTRRLALAIGLLTAELAAAPILSGCSPAQDRAWARIGDGIKEKCLTMPRAVAALQHFQDAASLPDATPESVAETVALTDGLGEALCAANVLVSHLGEFFAARELGRLVASAGRFAAGTETARDRKLRARRLARRAAQHLVEHADGMPKRLEEIRRAHDSGPVGGALSP